MLILLVKLVDHEEMQGIFERGQNLKGKKGKKDGKERYRKKKKVNVDNNG